MSKTLIVINKIGDEFKFFSKMIKQHVEILYIGNQSNNIKKYYEKLISLNLIKSFTIKKVNVKKHHYCFEKTKENAQFVNSFDSIYTYGLNNDILKDDIINYFSIFEDKLKLLSDNDFPQKVVTLSEDEFCLKYNIMINLGLKPEGNFIESYSQYDREDILIYYEKKYSHAIFDYEKSTYIIDIQYAILDILKKYKFNRVLLWKLSENMISSRVEFNNILFETKINSLYDTVICSEPITIKNIKYVITINCKLDNSFKIKEKYIINPILEKLYKDDYKSNINYERPEMEIVLYEKK